MSEAEDRRFDREEMGELLKLFSALGLTVAGGVAGFFYLGVRVDAWLAEAGRDTHGSGKIGCLFIGLGLSVGWAYLRIVKHLEKFTPRPRSPASRSPQAPPPSPPPRTPAGENREDR